MKLEAQHTGIVLKISFQPFLGYYVLTVQTAFKSLFNKINNLLPDIRNIL